MAGRYVEFVIYPFSFKEFLETLKSIQQDVSIREAIFESNQRDINQIFENIIYLELLRKGYNVKVGKVNNLEVDFVCTKGNEKIYIQVAYLLASPETI